MSPIVLIAVFIASSLIGYSLIKKVPSLLHTPLMSGMNALSGITILGALTTLAIVGGQYGKMIGGLLGGLAIVLATVNVTGGFMVTHRMLRMFDRKKRPMRS